MNKDKLLNQLIDEIQFIEDNSFCEGIKWASDNIREMNKYDKQVAGHKTKAFKIIDLLKNK